MACLANRGAGAEGDPLRQGVVDEAHSLIVAAGRYRLLSRADRASLSACSGSAGRLIERQPMNLSGRTSSTPSSPTSRSRAQS